MCNLLITCTLDVNMVITLILEALIGIGRLLISFNLLSQILLVFGMRRGNHGIISLLREISVGC